MTAPRLDRVGELARAHPEWRLWLDLLSQALREARNPAWAAWARPAPARDDARSPLLADAVIRLDGGVARRWVRTLFTAAENGRSPFAPLMALCAQSLDAVPLLEAVLCQDRDRVSELAPSVAAEDEAFPAVADLAAWPLLQAVGGLWTAAVPLAWGRGYCPICGAWAALGEVRGIGRSRHLRCAQCGSDWTFDGLQCPFCDTVDCDRIELLVEGAGLERRRIETCSACRGYMKTFTRLQGSPRDEVILDDLDSIDLDAAALGEGYTRPEGPGRRLGLRLEEKTTSSVPSLHVS